MGSDFGTLLDGQRVDVARLRAGQTLLLGSASLNVIDLAASADGATPQAPEEVAPPEDHVKELPPSSPPPPKEPTPPPASEKSFLEIPGYSIQETLGRGGMGAVFRARQDRLHRDVALKILSPRLAADTEFVRQFHREAQSAAALNHPNVVTVYDVGEAGGTHFLAMEYMDNESLEELLTKEGRLAWRSVADLLLGAARGLVYAESRGIVHRDIKPSNLMLNSAGQVKIADLGLAQRADDEAGDGRVFGTPHFMSPEQIRGETVDRRSDIYSLGATGYRLLSGYTPFEGVNSREILRAALTEEFEPLSAHVSGVPVELTSLIERMISRDPSSRPQSAESVADHLESALAGRAAPSAPKPITSSAPKSKAGLIAVILIAAGIVAAWQPWKGLVTTVTPPGPDALAEETSSKDPTNAAPAVTPEQVPTPPDQEQPRPDDDVAQKLFEVEAENELLRLKNSERSLGDRQAALLALAEKYNGTTAAATAREEAASVGEVIRMESQAEAAIASRREAVMLALRAAANLDADPPRPGDSLRAMATVLNQDHLATDPPFLEQREALRVAVCKRGLDQAQAQLERAKALLSSLDTSAVHDSLQDLVIRLQLPEFAIENRPLHFEALRQVASEATDLLRNLDTHRDEVVTGLELEDAVSIAKTCHSAEGIERDLAALQPGEAAAKLETLAGALSTDESRAVISSHASDLRGAAAALLTLSSEFDSWRRKSIDDPRPRRSNTEVLSISADGVQIQGSDGSELIEWSAFADQPGSLHQLFLRRLNRAWTAEEEEGIAALIRHAAILNTLRVTRSGFDDPSELKEKDLERALEGYKPPRSWADKTVQGARLRHELEAATSLTHALGLAAKGQWGSATSTLTHTTRTYPDTLLLLILSDGRGAPESTPEPPAPNEPTPPGEGLDPEGPAVPSPPSSGD
jgi:serine/threonine protein kinase